MVAEFFGLETLVWGDCARRWPKQFWRSLVFGVIGSASMMVFLAWWANDRLGPPMTLGQDISPASVSAREGGTLTMQVHAAPGRMCSAQISRFLWRWDTTPKGDKVKNFFPLYSPPVPITDAVQEPIFRISLELPVGVTPGQYFYTARLSTWCGVWGILFGDDTTTATADVPITILPRS